MYKKSFSSLATFVGTSFLIAGICSCGDDKAKNAKREFDILLQKTRNLSSAQIDACKNVQISGKEEALKFINNFCIWKELLLGGDPEAAKKIVFTYLEDGGVSLDRQYKELEKQWISFSKKYKNVDPSDDDKNAISLEMNTYYNELLNNNKQFVEDFCNQHGIKNPLVEKGQ